MTTGSTVNAMNSLADGSVSDGPYMQMPDSNNKHENADDARLTLGSNSELDEDSIRPYLPKCCHGAYDVLFEEKTDESTSQLFMVLTEIFFVVLALLIAIIVAASEVVYEPYSILDIVLTVALFFYIVVTYIVLSLEENIVLSDETFKHKQDPNDASSTIRIYVLRYSYGQLLFWLFFAVAAIVVSSIPMQDPLPVKRMGIAFRIFFVLSTFFVNLKQRMLYTKILSTLKKRKNKYSVWLMRTIQSYVDVGVLALFYGYTTFEAHAGDDYAYVVFLCFIFLFNLVNSIEVTANVNTRFQNIFLDSDGRRKHDYRIKVLNYVVLHESVLASILAILNKLIELTRANAGLYD
jgi:hypothetical protein